MNTQEVIELYNQYVIGNYGRLPKVIVRGKGNWIVDMDGNKILDLFPGWAVSGIGHCHPRVVEAIQKQAAQLIHMDNTFYTLPQGQLAKLLSERSFGGKCFFCNSGAEANEAALKLARKYTAKGKYKFITTEKSFHGRTFGALTATAQPKYHDGFLPLVPGFEYVPFNDIDALTEAFSDETAAVLVEPIQGEGGINPASAEYLHTIRNLCDEFGAVMILDEVQTGMGRTGRWFAYQHIDVIPDIITLAKALGGGTAIGAIIAKPEVAAALVPGSHASTFGGNPLACAAGIAVIEAIEEEHLLENTQKMGEYAQQKLNELKNKFPIIDSIRGIGLMLGVQLNIPGAAIVSRCLEKGLRINCTQETVLRIMPSMTITAEELDQAFAILADVLAEETKK
ncbi:MAG TPA: aspartate aminotransferase family protein [Anaerohalosphaeraceae bacterium]|jgi:acetylornithine/N-succinyldiaminopimelate aminotransferase|nr:aspartate aminotransferase family protein [Anaerohalosphaeraceae bacterium]HOT72412.1 aspartate aminotransferase family protein [Anaerohalosphaeraceae bacterium]HQG05919.1 aspartate aminotransferase family protein [Anaerohalosphaeraceae bacterium]HQI07201.1 aspartate aminotransferase family protein [Anaerohalosphaeraceae bacterium]HQJ67354.1 aspartate aminotransferase family protein [Anaerohalosphaeraceae bacterium]